MDKNAVNTVSVKKIDQGFFIVSGLALCYFLWVFGVCVFRYNTFQYHDWDFSLHINMMWNLSHGDTGISIIDRHFLGNHFTLIAFILAPVYFIFRHPLTLIFFQVFLLSFTAVPIYLIAKKYFGQRDSALFGAIYLLYPALYYVGMYEFHFETFAPFFLCWAFYFLISDRKAVFLIFALLAMLCKENIPPIVAAMGFYALCLRKGARLLGGITFLAAMGYFLLVTLKLQPAYTTQTEVGYALHYAKYGGNFGEIFKFIAFHPLTIVRDMFLTPSNMKYLAEIFGPLLFLPVVSPDILFIVLPTFLKSLLTEASSSRSVYWHYTATSIPFLVIALIYSVKRINQKAGFEKYGIYLLSFIVVTEIAAGVNFYKTRTSFVDYHYPAEAGDLHKKEALMFIPRGAGVIATFDFLPHLCNRENIYTFYTIWSSFWEYKKAVDADFALLDFNDYFILKDIMFTPDKVAGAILPYVAGEGWGVRYRKGDTVLMQKGYNNGRDKILSVLDNGEIGPEGQKPRLTIDGVLELADYKANIGAEHDAINMDLYWKLNAPLEHAYMVYFFLSDGKYDKLIHRHLLGYGLLAYQNGKISREKYELTLPKGLTRQKYLLTAAFVNASDGRAAVVAAADPKSLDGRMKFKLGVFSYGGK